MSSIFCFYDQIPLGSPEKKRLYATQAPSIAGGSLLHVPLGFMVVFYML